jgi:exoribonuclease R
MSNKLIVSGICQKIRDCNLSNEELNAIQQSLTAARQALAADTAWNTSVGDKVQFRSTRIGVTVSGVVTKVNRKNILVRAEQTGVVWRVPANMLTKVA